MAHVALLNTPCDHDGCEHRATREVVGRDHARRGVYCRGHAELVRHEVDRQEARTDRKDRAATGSLPVTSADGAMKEVRP
jgi:hypothetical protein